MRAYPVGEGLLARVVALPSLRLALQQHELQAPLTLGLEPVLLPNRLLKRHPDHIHWQRQHKDPGHHAERARNLPWPVAWVVLSVSHLEACEAACEEGANTSLCKLTARRKLTVVMVAMIKYVVVGMLVKPRMAHRIGSLPLRPQTSQSSLKADGREDQSGSEGAHGHRTSLHFMQKPSSSSAVILTQPGCSDSGVQGTSVVLFDQAAAPFDRSAILVEQPLSVST